MDVDFKCLYVTRGKCGLLFKNTFVANVTRLLRVAITELLLR